MNCESFESEEKGEGVVDKNRVKVGNKGREQKIWMRRKVGRKRRDMDLYWR